MKILLQLWKTFKNIIDKKKTTKHKVPKKVIEHLKLREGVKKVVYLDSLGKPTVGVGHLVLPEDNLKVGDTISDKKINELLQKDSLKAYEAALTQAEELGKLGDEDFVVVLTSVNYQLGTNWTGKFYNTWRHIRNKNYNQAIKNLKNSLWYKQTPVRVKDFIEVLK